MVPGSPFLVFEKSSLLSNRKLFDNLVGVQLTIQQGYLLVRRFVQCTGAHWDFDCLARIEKKLPEATALRQLPPDIFPEIVIELPPMKFDTLSRCAVGRLLQCCHEMFRAIDSISTTT